MPVVIESGITIGGRIGIGIAPTITVETQPSSVTAYQGGIATFTTSATAQFGSVVSYQWAKLEAQGGSWTNILGATSSSYTTGTLTVASDNGDQYRCVISGTRGAATVNTNAATLTVQQSVITIDGQPQNTTVLDGSLFTFTVYASVTLSATLSYQWYIYSGGTWNEIVGATTFRYDEVGYSNMSGNQYRVIVSATRGATPVTSNTVTLTVVIPNSMIVASSFNGSGTSTGASKGTYGFFLGTLTSDYLEAVYTYNTGSFINTFVRLTPGSYGSFTVGSNGQIDNDTSSYPRIFSINNTDYTMFYMGNDYFYTFNGNLGLTDGTTVPVSYSGQPSIVPNTIFSSSYTAYGETTFGASTGLNNPGYGSGDGAVFGSVITEYFYQVTTRYTGTAWVSIIWMKNGPWSGFTVSNGVVSGDTTGSTRVFTIGGTNYTFTAQTNDPSQPYYLYEGQITELTANTGTFVPTIYDPAENGGGGQNTAVGTITVGSFAGQYGWQMSLFGSGNFNPTMVYLLYFDGASTSIMFITGTYGSVVVTSTTIDGMPDVTVTVGNITETGTLQNSGGPGPQATFTGDIFNLQSQQYQTLPVEILASGGGGGSVTYTGGVDYQNNNQMGQPGIYFSSPPSGNSVFVYSAAWTTPAGATALLALTSGSTFTVVTPDTSGAPVTAIITLTSTYNTNWGSPSATVTTNVPISFQYPNNVPVSVTLGGGGGGGQFASGSLTVGYYGGNGEAGYDPYSPIGPIGSITLTPSILIDNLVYLPNQNRTLIIFMAGTYGSVVVTSTTINGSSSVSVTIGGTTQQGTLTSFGPGATGLQLTGDVFSLSMNIDQTLPISFSTQGGGGGTSETFTQAGNWSSAQWMYNGMGTGRLIMFLESNPNSSFLAAINSVTGSSGTTVTMTDTYLGTSSAVAITGINSSSSSQPWGPYSIAAFNLASHTGQDWNNINTITLATSGGGGGTTISNISNLFHDGYASPQSTTTFSFATQQQRDAAYTLLNAPGNWNCVGNYISPFFDGGSPRHGSFVMALAGPSSTDDNGPPSFMYRVISPSNISGVVSDGPAGPGPFSASK